jgi:probable HAF family extracellular repeat protein
LGTLGGSSSWAYAINAAGQAAGSAYTQFGDKDGFLYTPGVGMIDLGRFDFAVDVLGMNDADQIVGYGEDLTPGSTTAFVYSPGVGYKSLNTLIPTGSGWTLQEATAINDAGQIVGYGLNSSGAVHAFLLTPVPEPGTFAVITLGVAGLLRRRRNPT